MASGWACADGYETAWEPCEPCDGREITRSCEALDGKKMEQGIILPSDGKITIPCFMIPVDIFESIRKGIFIPNFNEVITNFRMVLEEPSNSNFTDLIEKNNIEGAIIELIESTCNKFFEKLGESDIDKSHNNHGIRGDLPGKHNISVYCSMYYYAMEGTLDEYALVLKIIMARQHPEDYLLLDTTIHYSANPKRQWLDLGKLAI